MNRMRKLWEKSTISMKFSVGLWVVIILMFLSAAASTLLLYQSMKGAEEARAAGERAAQITEIGTLFKSKDARIIDYLLDPGDRSVKLYTQEQNKLNQAEKKLKPYMNTPDQKKWFSQIITDDSRLFNLFQSEFVPAVLMNQKKELSRVHQEQNTIQERSIKRINQLRDSVIDEQQRAMDLVRKQVIGAMLFLAVSIVVTLLISCAITWRVSKEMKHSFRYVIGLTERIAAGDLTEHEKAKTNKDELGLIADSMEKMKADLLELIRMMVQAARRSKTSGQALIQSTQSVSTESKEMIRIMDQLANGFDRQAANTVHIAQFTENFSERLTKEVAMLSSVLHQAQDASDLTETGRSMIENSQQHMKTIKLSVNDSSRKMEEFKQQLAQLTKFIESIGHIAGQTNLLALNAAIEAARTDQESSGFSVIADSIRKLSNQTSKSTKEMSLMLSAVYKGFDRVNDALNASQEQVENGVQQITNTGEVLSVINQDALDIRSSLTDVSSNLNEVSLIGVQMKQSLTEVAAVSQQSAASVAQVNQSMNKIERSIGRYMKEAKMIDDTSNQFEKVIQRFRLEH
ncbi:methyl-accepting chemotaxis protein [Sporolactobacillus terrae]|nr:methyl-accepting chemotaxis protein [Sporolactobacillus terrae]UAK17326.1 methyl-accepting chemotaxis protein [Sporolactobacillus terrae]